MQQQTNRPGRPRRFFIAACIIYWSMIFAPSPQLAATSSQRFVFQIVVSGLRPPELHALVNAGRLPNFARLHTQGAWTHNARIDADTAFLLPNRVSMLTGRPMLTRFGIPHSGHGWMSDAEPSLDATLHRYAGYYIASAFDVAHDQGLKTGLYATAASYLLFKRSFNVANAAPDITGDDDGYDKIDVFVTREHNSAQMVTDLLSNMTAAPTHYTFVQFDDLIATGEAYGWDSPAYKDTLLKLDGWLGDIFNLIQTNATLTGATSIVLTSDRGGSDIDDTDPSDPFNYTVPMFVWGPDMPQNVDLYTLNGPNTGNPGGRYVNYVTSAQPIRNGDSANCALRRLELPPIPNSPLDRLANACASDPSVPARPPAAIAVARPVPATPTPIYVFVTTTPMPTRVDVAPRIEATSVGTPVPPLATPAPVVVALLPTNPPAAIIAAPSAAIVQTNSNVANTSNILAVRPTTVLAVPATQAKIAAPQPIPVLTTTPPPAQNTAKAIIANQGKAAGITNAVIKPINIGTPTPLPRVIPLPASKKP